MRIPPTASPEAQQAFRDVWTRLDALNRDTVDWTGRRIVNAGDGIDAQDYVTLAQLRRAVTPTSSASSKTASVGSGTIRVGAFSTRGAANRYANGVFFASDYNYVGWVSDGANWNYATGVQYGTLSPDQKPTLTTSDIGYRFRATDFQREYRWSGSAWTDAPGSPARGHVAFFPYSLDATCQPGSEWHLCDGTASVTISKSDGTTTTITVPDLTTAHRFPRATSGTTGITGGSATTHTHTVDPPNTTSALPSTNATGTDGGSTTVQSGSGTTVAAHTHNHNMSNHTHDVDIAAFASAGPSGSSGDDALPPYYDMRPYIRL